MIKKNTPEKLNNYDVNSCDASNCDKSTVYDAIEQKQATNNKPKKELHGIRNLGITSLTTVHLAACSEGTTSKDTDINKPTEPPPTNAIDSNRTFSFLGLNSASLATNMNRFQNMADGTSISVWNFGNGFNNDRSVPCPVIEGVEGENVSVTLSSMMPHSLHLHGLDVNQTNDGFPATSGFVGRAMGMGGRGGMPSNFGRVQDYTSLGQSYTYRFIAPHAGTYEYHCHVDTVLHMEMGMYGTIIIRPSNGRFNQAWTNGPEFDKEYIWQLHTFDSTWHNQLVSGPNTVRYRPDYFLINGRDGDLLNSDPTVAVTGNAGDRILIRTINLGYLPYQISLGGLTFEVIASDGRPLPQPIKTTTYLTAPGERYDLLLTLAPNTNRTATINYQGIRLDRILGTASTTITTF